MSAYSTPQVLPPAYCVRGPKIHRPRMWTRLGTAFTAALAVSGSAFAASLSPNQETCISQAAAWYHRPTDPISLQGFIDLIHAVQAQENGCGRVVPNKDGSRDIGCMQINSSHLPLLARYGISEQALFLSDCQNILVGVWILHSEITNASDLWTGVGNYNTGPGKRTPKRVQKNLQYQGYVWMRLQRLWAARLAGR